MDTDGCLWSLKLFRNAAIGFCTSSSFNEERRMRDDRGSAWGAKEITPDERNKTLKYSCASNLFIILLGCSRSKKHYKKRKTMENERWMMNE